MKSRHLDGAIALERAWRHAGSSWAEFMNRLDRKRAPYLSHSKVGCLERCPRCYYREYIRGEREEFPAMVLGLRFHAAARWFYDELRKGSMAKLPALMKFSDAKSESFREFRNALTLLRHHCWEDHQVVAIEAPFFLDLADGLPPIIGIPDLVLSRHDSLVVVDHKTSRSFNDCDPGQLVLYAEQLRRQHDHDRIVGVFDEYRLVRDLDTVRKPAFRRTPVSVDRSLVPPLIERYRAAWSRISDLMNDDEPPAAAVDCWICARRED